MSQNRYEPVSVTLLERLKEILASATHDKDRKSLRMDKWWVHDGTMMPGHDLNRDFIEPGTDDKYPEGAVSIMASWDFYCIAVLPLWVRDIPTTQLIGALFPDIDTLHARPDSGDYWWVAKGDQDLEVPGEPFELWDTIKYLNGHITSERYNSYVSIEDVTAAERRMDFSMTEGIEVMLEIRQWHEGVRSTTRTMLPSNITFTPPNPRARSN